MPKKTPKERSWLIDIFQDDEPIQCTAGGLIEAPDKTAALEQSRKMFRAWESWRVSVRELKEKRRKKSKE